MGFPVLAQVGVSLALAGLSYILSRRRKDDLPESERGIERSDDAPSRWVIGKARTGGLLVQPPVEVEPSNAGVDAGTLETNGGPYRDIHMAIAISEGKCFGLESIWINETRYDLSASVTESDGSIRYVSSPNAPPYSSQFGDLFLVRSCFSGSGNQGAAYRRVAEVTGSSFLKGISWIHLHLRQPFNAEDRGIGYDRIPDVEFLVVGSVIEGDSVTDSAVKVRNWWQSTILGDTTPIDADSLASATIRGDEIISTELDGRYWRYENSPLGPNADPDSWSNSVLAPTVEEPVIWASQRFTAPEGGRGVTPPHNMTWGQPFPWRIRLLDGTIRTIGTLRTTNWDTQYQRAALSHSAKRYSVNGVILGSLNPTDISEEFDFATQGEMVHDGSKWHILVGEDRDAVLDWDVDDSSLIEWSLKKSDIDRFGSIDMSIAQSAPSDFLDAKLPRISTSSGDVAQIRKSILINHPIDGGRILATFWRRSLQDDRIIFTCLPSTSEPYALKKGDTINLSIAAANLSGTRCVIEQLIIHGDLTVTIDATISPEGAYADTISLPDEDDRPLTILPPQIESDLLGFFIPERDGLDLKLVPTFLNGRSFRWAATEGDADNSPDAISESDVIAGACASGEITAATLIEGQYKVVRIAAIFYTGENCSGQRGQLQTRIFTYDPGALTDLPQIELWPTNPTGTNASGREAALATVTHGSRDVALRYRTYTKGSVAPAWTRNPAAGHVSDPHSAKIVVNRPAEGAANVVIEAQGIAAPISAGGSEVFGQIKTLEVDSNIIPSIAADLTVDDSTGQGRLTVIALDADTFSYRGRVTIGAIDSETFPAVAFAAHSLEFSGSHRSGGESGGARIGVPFDLPGDTLEEGQAYFVTLFGFRTQNTSARSQSASLRSPPFYASAGRTVVDIPDIPDLYRGTTTYELSRDSNIASVFDHRIKIKARVEKIGDAPDVDWIVRLSARNTLPSAQALLNQELNTSSATKYETANPGIGLQGLSGREIYAGIIINGEIVDIVTIPVFSIEASAFYGASLSFDLSKETNIASVFTERLRISADIVKNDSAPDTDWIVRVSTDIGLPSSNPTPLLNQELNTGSATSYLTAAPGIGIRENVSKLYAGVIADGVILNQVAIPVAGLQEADFRLEAGERTGALGFITVNDVRRAAGPTKLVEGPAIFLSSGAPTQRVRPGDIWFEIATDDEGQ